MVAQPAQESVYKRVIKVDLVSSDFSNQIRFFKDATQRKPKADEIPLVISPIAEVKKAGGSGDKSSKTGELLPVLCA